MKFKIDKAEIINEFQSLAAVADKKQTLPILSNILIRCETDSIRLLSTDLEVELDVSRLDARPHLAFAPCSVSYTHLRAHETG